MREKMYGLATLSTCHFRRYNASLFQLSTIGQNFDANSHVSYSHAVQKHHLHLNIVSRNILKQLNIQNVHCVIVWVTIVSVNIAHTKYL